MVYLRQSTQTPWRHAFTLVEVAVSMVLLGMFALATFATNERLMIALKSQKETTTATMVMQWRMEQLRAVAFSQIASAGSASDYVMTNVLQVRTASVTNPDGSTTTIDPFAALGNVTETITVGAYPADGSTSTVMTWTNGVSTYSPQNPSLSSKQMLKVDVLESWLSASGRPRQRQLSTVVTTGNTGI